MKKLYFFILSVFLCLNNLYSQQIVSVTSGSDLITVRNQVRALNDNMTEDIVIELSGGNYFLNETLLLTEQDSASNGYRIIWRNKANERPVISGGVQLTNWQDEGDGIISTSVTDGFIFRQLYVNNKKASRAKFLDGVGNWARVKYNNAGKHFYLSNAKAIAKGIQSWSQVDNVEINVVSTFVSSQPKLDSITSNTTTTYLHVAEPVGSILTNIGHFQQNSNGSIIYPYDIYFENAYEFIDEPGEWYLDVAQDKIYYKLRTGETISNVSVIAPSLETILEVTNTKKLVFYGISFEHSNWIRPSEYGFSGIQNMYREAGGTGYNYNVPIPAAINIGKSENIMFERNIIRFTGGTGIMAFDDSTVNLALIGNVFYKTAASPLMLGDDDKKGAIEPKEGLYRAYVSNNYFYKCGIDYASPIIFGTFPYQIDINHNEMLFGQPMGLNLGWGGLNYKDLLYRPLVEYNKFDSIARVGSDVSIFHTRNLSYGSRIHKNWFDNSVKSVDGRITGRYNVKFNDPKWGNMYLDNDAKDNNFVGNVHTNFSSNGYNGGKDGHYIFGAKSTPNYIIKYNSATDISEVIENAGLQYQYEDIKNYIFEGCIGGVEQPIQHPMSRYLLNDRDSEITYVGSWTQLNNVGSEVKNGAYLSNYTRTTANNDYAEFSFTGIGFEIFGPLVSSSVDVEIIVDNVAIDTLSISGNNEWQKTWYTKSNLPLGLHTVKLVKLAGAKLTLDGFVIIPSASPNNSVPFSLTHAYEEAKVGALPSDHIVIKNVNDIIEVQENSNATCSTNKLKLIDNTTNSNIKVIVPFTDLYETVHARFDVNPFQTNGNFHFDLLDGSITATKVAFGSDGNIRVYDGNTATVVQSYNSSETYRVYVTANNSLQNIYVTINENQYGPFDFKATTISKINKFRLLSLASKTGTVELDNLIISNHRISDEFLAINECESTNLAYTYNNIDLGSIPTDHEVNITGNGSVETIEVACGNKVLEIDDESTTSKSSFSIPFAQETGDLFARFDVEAAQNNKPFHFDLRSGTVTVVKFTLGSDGNFRIFNGATSTILTNYNANTLYRIEIKNLASSELSFVSIDGQEFGPFNFKNKNQDYINNFKLSSKLGKVGKLEIDNLILFEYSIPESLLPKPICPTDIVQDYESTASGNIPTDHIFTLNSGTAIGVQQVSNCNTNMLSVNDNSPSSTSEIKVNFTPNTGLTYSRFDVKPLQANSTFHFDLRDKTKTVVKVALGGDGNFRVYNGSQSTIIKPYAANTLYRVLVTANNSTKMFNIDIDGQQYGPYQFKNLSGAAIDNFRLLSLTSTVGQLYFDKLVVSGNNIPQNLLPLDNCSSQKKPIIKEVLKTTLVYPNPFSGYLKIESKNAIKHIVIFDISGRKVKKLTINKASANLNLSTLRKGLYFLKVLIPNEKTKVFKIIKK